MDLGFNINVADLPENEGFLSIEAGWYAVTIDTAEVKPTKSGTGLSIKYLISGPTNANRGVFGFINITNASAECERIGRGDLGSLSRAVGLVKISDSDQLLNKSLEIQVTKNKDTSQYADANGFSNNIKAFRALKGGAMSQSKPATAKAAAAPAAGGLTPPWA